MLKSANGGRPGNAKTHTKGKLVTRVRKLHHEKLRQLLTLKLNLDWRLAIQVPACEIHSAIVRCIILTSISASLKSLSAFRTSISSGAKNARPCRVYFCLLNLFAPVEMCDRWSRWIRSRRGLGSG